MTEAQGSTRCVYQSRSRRSLSPNAFDDRPRLPVRPSAQRPASVGVIVNETNSDVSVEMTTTIANSDKLPADLALNERDREEDDDVDERDDDRGRADFLAPADGGFLRRLPELGEMPLDVFEHDGRVVDQDADDERHAEQRNRVDRETASSS